MFPLAINNFIMTISTCLFVLGIVAMGAGVFILVRSTDCQDSSEGHFRRRSWSGRECFFSDRVIKPIGKNYLWNWHFLDNGWFLTGFDGLLHPAALKLAH